MALVMASFLHSQSLTELAKKEKERREALKGKSARVVTNADLAKIKKRPAVELGTTVEEMTLEELQALETAEAGQTQTETVPPGQSGEAAAVEEIPETKAEESPMSEREFKARLAELQGKVEQAQELIDLMSLKMNALWQEFYSLDDMTSRELIQMQISQTYEKLTKAQVDWQKAQTELDDFMANSRRQGVPQIWIR